MNIVEIQVLVQLLNEALNSAGQRKTLMARYEELVGEAEIVNATSSQIEVLEDLSHDIAFYSTNPEARREDGTLFGDEELLRRIRSVLSRLEKDG